MTNLKKIVYGSLILLLLSGCESERERKDKIYSEALNDSYVYSKFYDYVVNHEIAKINKGENSTFLNLIMKQMDESILVDIAKERMNYYNKKYNSDKKFKHLINKRAKDTLIEEYKNNKNYRKIAYEEAAQSLIKGYKYDKYLRRTSYKEAKKSLIQEFINDTKLRNKILSKITTKLEKEIEKKERAKQLEKNKIQNTLNVLDKNIEYFDMLFLNQLNDVCSKLGNIISIYKIIGQKDGCEYTLYSTNHNGRFYEVFGQWHRFLMDQDISIMELEFTKGFSEVNGILKQKLKMMIQYKKKQQEYLKYKQEIQVKQSAIEVARTLNNTKVLSKMQKELTQTMHSISKRLSNTNVQ